MIEKIIKYHHIITPRYIMSLQSTFYWFYYLVIVLIVKLLDRRGLVFEFLLCQLCFYPLGGVAR